MFTNKKFNLLEIPCPSRIPHQQKEAIPARWGCDKCGQWTPRRGEYQTKFYTRTSGVVFPREGEDKSPQWGGPSSSTSEKRRPVHRGESRRSGEARTCPAKLLFDDCVERRRHKWWKGGRNWWSAREQRKREPDGRSVAMLLDGRGPSARKTDGAKWSGRKGFVAMLGQRIQHCTFDYREYAGHYVWKTSIYFNTIMIFSIDRLETVSSVFRLHRCMHFCFASFYVSER